MKTKSFQHDDIERYEYVADGVIALLAKNERAPKAAMPRFRHRSLKAMSSTLTKSKNRKALSQSELRQKCCEAERRAALQAQMSAQRRRSLIIRGSRDVKQQFAQEEDAPQPAGFPAQDAPKPDARVSAGSLTCPYIIDFIVVGVMFCQDVKFVLITRVTLGFASQIPFLVFLKGHIPWSSDPNRRVQTLRVQRKTPSAVGDAPQPASSPVRHASEPGWTFAGSAVAWMSSLRPFASSGVGDAAQPANSPVRHASEPGWTFAGSAVAWMSSLWPFASFGVGDAAQPANSPVQEVSSDPYTGSTCGMCGDGEEAQKAKTKDDTKMCEYYDLKQPALRWCFPCEASRIFASKANVSEEDRELVQRCARRHMHPGDSSPLSKRASDTCMSSLGCRLVCNKAGWESNSERRFCDHDNNLSHRSFPGRRKIRLSAW